MDALLTLLAIVLLPVGVTSAILALLRRVSGRQAAGRRRTRLDHLVRELSRLGAEHAELVQRDRCTDGERLRAVAAQYDDVLLAC